MKTQKSPRKKAESSGTNEKEGEGSNSEEGSEVANRAQTSSLNNKNKKRGRPKKSSQDKAAEKEEEIDMFAKLPKEKEEQFGIILSEINRKMMQQQFQID